MSGREMDEEVQGQVAEVEPERAPVVVEPGDVPVASQPEDEPILADGSLAARLGQLGQQVPPPSIADVWLFPPLPEVESSSEFLLFTRILEDGCRGLYSASMAPANGKPAHQVVVEHGQAPADRVMTLVSGLQRRLGSSAPPRHVPIEGDSERWQALLDRTREADQPD